jgi:2,3-bisphosphoglycerate-dependent phosphoglycerate mutase
MAYLILIRHGESQWNELGKWTGWTDIDLNEKGKKEAKEVAGALKNIPIDIAYTSPLLRAKNTLHIILNELHTENIPIIESDAIREKNYGNYTGKNKWEVKAEVGEEEFKKIRRSWNYRLPNGESLEDVYNRSVAYYQTEILPNLKKGKNVLLTSHGNTVRALVKFLDNVSDEDISGIEIATGDAYIYTINEEGSVINKQIISTHPNTV